MWAVTTKLNCTNFYINSIVTYNNLQLFYWLNIRKYWNMVNALSQYY